MSQNGALVFLSSGQDSAICLVGGLERCALVGEVDSLRRENTWRAIDVWLREPRCLLSTQTQDKTQGIR